MTIDKAIKLLQNTKVDLRGVNGISDSVIVKVMNLRWQYYFKSSTYVDEKSSFLFIDSNLDVHYGNSYEQFRDDKRREISPLDILSIEITEPKYRPFKNIQECWQEMQNHPSLGWLKDLDTSSIYGNAIRNIVSVDQRRIGIMKKKPFNGHNSLRYYDFEEAFKNFTFTDGIPFGIKEE